MKKSLLMLSFALGVALLWNTVAQATEEKVNAEPISVVAVEKVHETEAGEAGEAIQTVPGEVTETVCCPDPCAPVMTQCCYEPCCRPRCCGWRARRMARWGCCNYGYGHHHHHHHAHYYPTTTDCGCR
ncbi:MAG: hypothetical protein Q4D98_10995 [Planctomycetia bacterium]|nr:hypothetical protein [Planctomycetia bacterium]